MSAGLLKTKNDDDEKEEEDETKETLDSRRSEVLVMRC